MKLKRLVVLLIIFACILCSCTPLISTENANAYTKAINFNDANMHKRASPPPRILSSINATSTFAPQRQTTEAKTPDALTDVAESICRFVIAGDSRGLYKDEVGKYDSTEGPVNIKIIRHMLDRISALDPQPNFMMTLGDYTMGSKSANEEKQQLQQFLDISTEYFPEEFYYPCFGNHEICQGKTGINLFSDIFDDFQAEFFAIEKYGRTVYWFQIANCNFFVINSDAPDEEHQIDDEVMRWMRAKSSKAGTFNFFFVHEPSYPSGNHIGRSLDKYPKQRDQFWRFIQEQKGAIVFNAHEHQYMRRLVDNTFKTYSGIPYEKPVYQITTAGMGAPFHDSIKDDRGVIVGPILAFHYIVADIYKNHIMFQALDLQGNILDRFEIRAEK